MAVKFTRRQIGIALLATVTGLIHLILLNIIMFRVYARLDLLFTLNGVGFLALAFVFLVPVPFLRAYRKWIRWIFIAYTLLTIAAWLAVGDKSLPSGWLGYLTKLVEVGLVYLLWLEK